jgi:YfiH family protein
MTHLHPPDLLGRGVSAFFTTRDAGNLATHVGDDPLLVAQNRSRLRINLPAEPIWLSQVHGTEVHEVTHREAAGVPIVADASVTSLPSVVLSILTADCLPVLIADCDGRVVGAAHAGWRGLAGGILEATARAMRSRVNDARLRAWIGPAIHQPRYEVGEEVRVAMLADGVDSNDGDYRRVAESLFIPSTAQGKWMFDLPGMASLRLQRLGITVMPWASPCTASNPEQFWSFRRDRSIGRTAGCIWIDPTLNPI